jgi:replication-associated recombination protein RarA
MELDSSASIDEIKQLRNFLLHQGLEKGVGIVNLLNRFSNEKQAVFLKIFEELPSYSMCYFTASFLPNFTLQSRCQIIYLPCEMNKNLTDFMNKIVEDMKKGQHSKIMIDKFKIMAATYSFLEDGVIKESDMQVILGGL